MALRITALVVLVWLFGFGWFAVAMPGPATSSKTDAVVVYTGGEGRIDRALQALRKGWSRKLLVSGVDREVRPEEFEAEYHVKPALMECCVTLGFDSVDTRSNALEAARWLARNKAKSVRLVTTDWHMRRAAYELDLAKPRGLAVLRDAVPSQPSLRILFLEYHKLIARRISRLWDA